MRPLRRVLAVLKEAVAAASWAQGGGAEDLLLRRLHQRLGPLRAQARRIRIVAALVLPSCVMALIVTPLALAAGGAAHAVVSTALALLLIGAALAANEASRTLTLLDSVEDVLSGGASTDRVQTLAVFERQVELALEPEPELELLARILSKAYSTSASIRIKLEQARVPVELVNMNQPPFHVWYEALRVAYRGERLDALLSSVLSDGSVAAYHDPLRRYRALLGV